MNSSSMANLRPEYIKAETLIGAGVCGPEGDHFDLVSNIVGIRLGAPITIDLGGILGFRAKPVALPASALNFMSDERGHVCALTTLNEVDLGALPEHK